MRTHAVCGAMIMLGMLLAGHPADAAIRITKNTGDEATPEEAELERNPETGGWDITLKSLHNAWSDTVYDITGTGGEVIDNIYIDIDGPAAGSPLWINVYSLGAGILHVRNIEQRGDAETFVSRVEAEGDIGSITAMHIGYVLAGRDITGPLIGTTSDNAIRGVFWAEAQRHVLGDVIAANGKIGIVFAHENIGTPDHPVTIQAKHLINQVTAFGDCYANVNARVNNGTGSMYVFWANRFVGSLEVQSMIPDAHTGSTGFIRITDSMDAQITIGSSFAGDVRMELPAQGFDGQITLNADGNPTGQWTAPVYLGEPGQPGTVLLEGPFYTQPASMLGGGSIGLAPYSIHDESCEPANGDGVQLAPEDTLVVKLRHYGPIRIDTVPVVVLRRPLDAPGGFSTVPAGEFNYLIDPFDPNTLWVMNLVPGDGFEPGYEYLIQSTLNLRCDIPAATPVQWNNPYLITIDAEQQPPLCPGDLDGDLAVDVDDFFTLLQNWGAINHPADLDASGVVDVSDFFLLLQNWGPCPQAMNSQGAGKSGPRR
jgi:hypothetical protein